MKVQLSFISLLFMSLSCQSQVDLDAKAQLTESVIQHPAVQFAKNSKGQIIIYENAYCEEIDCRKYFRDDAEKVAFLKKEDLFMRGIRQYIEIMAINEDNQSMRLKLTNGRGNVKGLEIKL